MIERVVLITNPASRLGARRVAAAEAAFRAAKVECTVARTTHAGHEADLASEAAPGVDAVFVLGGDGTVMNVASALAGTGMPIGILRGGTGNLLAGELGVPRSIPAAVASLVRGAVRVLDLGLVRGGRHFAFAAGMGIDAAMIRDTSTTAKLRWGMLGYAASAARSALRRETFEIAAHVDGALVYRGPAALAMVVNGSTLLGGLFTFAPRVSPDDGVLDLCVYAPRSFPDTIAIIWRLLIRDFRPDPRLRFSCGREIRIEADPVQLFESDGELVGHSPVEVSVVPAAAAFLVPAGSRGSSFLSGQVPAGRRMADGISTPNGIGYDSATAHRSSSHRGGAT